MLVELFVRDLALIERASLVFGPGLNAITGETGAGKSLLVEALELLLGQRARPGLVREGAGAAVVEARFELPDGERGRAFRERLVAECPELADELGDPGADGAGVEWILGRTVGADGRTRAHVQHRPVSLRALRALAPLLIEIHGQNDHQALLEPAEQLRLVDAWGRLDGVLDAYRAARAAWRGLVERRLGLEREAGARRDRLDLLRFQLGEIRALELRAGEREELAAEREVLRHAEALGAEIGGVAEALIEGDAPLADAVRGAAERVGAWRERVRGLEGPADDLAAAAVHLEDAARALASFAAGVEGDPARLELLEERLAEIERLERRHGAPGEALLELAERMAGEIEALEREEQDRSGLADAIRAARAELEGHAGELEAARRRLAPKLEKAVRGALRELGLARATFALAFRAPDEEDAADGAADGDPDGDPDAPGLERLFARDRRRFGESGRERVELRLAANPGEGLRSLREVASGGEAARILLALRGSMARGGADRVLVFDEIDAGVGGRLGPAVARHLRGLAAHHQVLCVTHLPAIAAAAHRHLRVEKEVSGGRTRTQVEVLDGERRVAEVADMIAGGAEHESARAEARRLLAGEAG